MASELTTLLLTGGASTRMGQDKAMLRWHDRPLWAQVAQQAAPLSLELWVLHHPNQRFDHPKPKGNLRFIADQSPHQGPLAALAQVAPQLSTPWGLVLCTDLPYLTGDFLAEFLARKQPGHAVAAMQQGRLNPLLALYPTPWLGQAPSLWARGERRAQALLELGPVIPLKDRPESQGINHPEEYQAALKGLT